MPDAADDDEEAAAAAARMAASFRPKLPANGDVIPVISPRRRILGLDETNVWILLVAVATEAVVLVAVVGDD
jgi:hypothetical protein